MMLTLPPGQWQALHDAYATPARAYHHYGHVQDVLDQFRAVADGPGWVQPREVQLAVLYHDAVYDPGRQDNEARSAALAEAEMGRWSSGQGIDMARVCELILATARHGQWQPQDFGKTAVADDMRHFLDCDMAILGADPARFDAYDRAIATEYRGQVPGWLYAINRRRFLKGLLARPRIYLSEFFHARCDGQARSNLRRAITTKR